MAQRGRFANDAWLCTLAQLLSKKVDFFELEGSRITLEQIEAVCRARGHIRQVRGASGLCQDNSYVRWHDANFDVDLFHVSR